MNETLANGIALASIPVLKRILLAVAATGADVGKVVAALECVPLHYANQTLDRIAHDVECGLFRG